MRLKELRESRKLLQKDIANHLHCSVPVYCRYEKGDRFPPYEVLSTLADFYGVSVDYILGRDPVPDTAQPTEIGEPEIRVLARDGGQLTPEQIKKRNALLRMLMAMDDDEFDTAEKLINIVSGKRTKGGTCRG